MGTAHVLEAVRAAGVRRACVVAITTDKVYRNREQIFRIEKTDPLGGHDPYSASKAAAEIVIASYRDAYLRAQGSRWLRRAPAMSSAAATGRRTG